MRYEFVLKKLLFYTNRGITTLLFFSFFSFFLFLCSFCTSLFSLYKLVKCLLFFFLGPQLFDDQSDLKELLENLHQNTHAKKRKNVEIMWLAATVSLIYIALCLTVRENSKHLKCGVTQYIYIYILYTSAAQGHARTRAGIAFVLCSLRKCTQEGLVGPFLSSM